MVPLYAARVQDLGPDDVAVFKCGACGHTAELPPSALLRGLGLRPTDKVFDLERAATVPTVLREGSGRGDDQASRLPAGNGSATALRCLAILSGRHGPRRELRNVHYASCVLDTAMSDNTIGRFDRFARWIEQQVGSPITFVMAVAVVLIWAISGPFFGWSGTWQLVINTGTTIVTFLMVFLIQSTQSRDTRALHLKLDELIRVNQAARNSLLNLEDMSEAEIQEVKKTFDRVIPASVKRH